MNRTYVWYYVFLPMFTYIISMDSVSVEKNPMSNHERAPQCWKAYARSWIPKIILSKLNNYWITVIEHFIILTDWSTCCMHLSRYLFPLSVSTVLQMNSSYYKLFYLAAKFGYHSGIQMTTSKKPGNWISTIGQFKFGARLLECQIFRHDHASWPFFRSTDM